MIDKKNLDLVLRRVEAFEKMAELKAVVMQNEIVKKNQILKKQLEKINQNLQNLKIENDKWNQKLEECFQVLDSVSKMANEDFEATVESGTLYSFEKLEDRAKQLESSIKEVEKAQYELKKLNDQGTKESQLMQDTDAKIKALDEGIKQILDENKKEALEIKKEYDLTGIGLDQEYKDFVDQNLKTSRVKTKKIVKWKGACICGSNDEAQKKEIEKALSGIGLTLCPNCGRMLY